MNTAEMETDAAKQIASAIDRAMRAHNGGRGISQAKLSRISGVPQPTISRTLKGETIPETGTLSKLIAALGSDNVSIHPAVNAILPVPDLFSKIDPPLSFTEIKSKKKTVRKTRRERDIEEIVSLLAKTNDHGVKSVLLMARLAATESPMESKQAV